jgi:cell division septal protein FtsQ
VRAALAQPRSVRDGLAVPWHRALAIAVGIVAVLALLYFAARATSVFAVRTLEIEGGTPAVRAAVRAAAGRVEGRSLVGLDGGALVRELEALPSVRSATYDRAFPSTLRIFVRAERPLAVISGSARWIVSERGRVIGPATEDMRGHLPHFRLPTGTTLHPGAFVTAPAARVILAALAVAPRRFLAAIDDVRLQAGALTLGLRAPWGTPELRLGEPVDVKLKLAVAALVLRSLAAAERPSVAYVDVSVPERTVIGRNPQPEGLG